MGSTRLRAIDAGRGAAMLFVFLSHFGESYLQHNHMWQTLYACWKISMIASPSFMLISGMMLGYVFSTNNAGFQNFKFKLIDRGLFLLTIAHLLILLSHIPLTNQEGVPLKWAFITDTIGVCIIAGPLIIEKTRAKNRLIMGLCLYLSSWLAVILIQTSSIFGNLLKELFVGSLQNKYFVDNFAIMPWLSVYLCGSYMGEKIGEYQLAGQNAKIGRYFTRVGILSVFIAIGIKTLVHFLVREHFLHASMLMSSVFNIFQKNPPAPLYLMFYGGAGLMMLSVLFFLVRENKASFLIDSLEIIGKTSLVAFILQYFIYFSVFVWLDLKFQSFWMIYFIVSVVVIFRVLHFWQAKGLNRYFSILHFPFRTARKAVEKIRS
jgi:uncharacterized membrane protein